MTAEELIRLDGPNRYELIKGELLTMSPTGDEHGRVTVNLTVLLHSYVKANNLGVIYNDVGFKLEENPDTVLGPDISFVARDRVGPRSPFFRSGPPDLAVELRSHYDRTTKIERKAAMWLELGAKSVWLVNPKRRTVDVIHANGDRRLFQDSEELFDDIVPGFRVKVSEIFE